MKYFSTILIHSCFAAFSSSDIFLYREEREAISNDTYGDDLILVSSLEDNTIYDKCLKSRYNLSYRASKEEMQPLVDKYISQGYFLECPKEIDEYLERTSQKEYDERKKAGYIFYTEKNEIYLREKAQGGFSNEFWDYPKVIEYTSHPTFGYFGHSCRKPELDVFFEHMFKIVHLESSKHEDDWKEYAYSFFSSTTARHVGDSLEEMNIDEQRLYIGKNIYRWWNEAFIFSLPEHGGTLNSTQELTEKYKDKLFIEGIHYSIKE